MLATVRPWLFRKNLPWSPAAIIPAYQFDTHGRSGHGPAFRRWADRLDAPRHCPLFETPKCGSFASTAVSELRATGARKS